VIVRSRIDLAHNLGLTVVAEGVEDELSMEVLVAYGCDSAQGHFFSRPCPAEEFRAWLAESPFGGAFRRDEPPVASRSAAAELVATHPAAKPDFGWTRPMADTLVQPRSSS
jgi:hypothetical protein